MILSETSFWHPFAHMSDVSGHELVLARGSGVWVEDDAGGRYLDALAGLWYCNVGHGRGELADAAASQMRSLAAFHTYGRLANRPALELASRICALAPVDDPAVFFTCGGSDAVDTAVKLARRYWHAEDQPNRQLIVSRQNAYHGMNGYGTSIAGIKANRADCGELMPGVITVPHDDTQTVEALFAERGDEIAAFIGEPVIGAGGVYPPSDDYWPAIQQACRDHGVLLIADEVVSAFGRLGTWFGSERFGMRPDVITCAKGLTSGYVPLGAVICSRRVRDAFWDPGRAQIFRHGYTYSGHPAACAVALANLDLIEHERLLKRVLETEQEFQARLQHLARHPLIAGIRACGFAAAVVVDRTAGERNHGLADKLAAAALDQGVITRALIGEALQVSPPLTISSEEIEVLATRLDRAINEVAVAQDDYGAAEREAPLVGLEPR